MKIGNGQTPVNYMEDFITFSAILNADRDHDIFIVVSYLLDLLIRRLNTYPICYEEHTRPH